MGNHIPEFRTKHSALIYTPLFEQVSFFRFLRLHFRIMAVSERREENVFDRISSLPVIKAVLGQMNNIYQITKAQHDLLSITFEQTEKGLHVASKVGAFVTRPIQKPLSALDGYACDSLDSLEQKFPIITKTPQDLYSGVQEYGQSKMDQASNFGREKMDQLKEYGLNTVSSVKDRATAVLRIPYDLMTKQIIIMMLYADTCVDHYMPDTTASFDKSIENIDLDASVKDISVSSTATEQLYLIGSKLRYRIYERAQDSWQKWTSPKQYLDMVGISLSDLPTWPQKQDNVIIKQAS